MCSKQGKKTSLKNWISRNLISRNGAKIAKLNSAKISSLKVLLYWDKFSRGEIFANSKIREIFLFREDLISRIWSWPIFHWKVKEYARTGTTLESNCIHMYAIYDYQWSIFFSLLIMVSLSWTMLIWAIDDFQIYL